MRRSVLPLLVVLAAGPAWAAEEPTSDDCLMCHADAQTASLADGREVKIDPVDAKAYNDTKHAKKISCVKCHVGMTTEHADGKPLPYKAKGELARRYVEACKSCHFQDFKKSLDGVHHKAIAAGNDAAPGCLDCHGAHAIANPHERGRIAEVCSGCHDKEADAFAKSVHGRSVLPDGRRNPDVPVCTDCHRAHDTIDVQDGQMALRTADICGRCHSDEKLMSRYKLSSDVVSTYLVDFHGMSATLQRGHAGRSTGSRLAPGCTDCHGVHDIQRARDAASPVIAANLQNTCQKCHAGASASFPKAWLSHYQPTPEKAPLVWLVQLFYRLMIPFMVGGLLLQIALHLWRVVVNR